MDIDDDPPFDNIASTPSSPCASIAEDSGVHARIPASTAIAAARLTSSPTPNVSGCASRGRLS